MKKVIALVLTLVMMVACFAACGNKEEAKTIVVGYTIYEPMNYMDENNVLVGFDTELATKVFENIGYKVMFQLIDWPSRYTDLNSGAIDCVWNGFTANSSDEGVKRSDLVDFSYGYMLNQQCVVVKAENLEAYKSEADLAGKTACVEGGSAGASYAESVTDADKIFSTTAQINAFTEVKSGAVDFIVVDIILAQNICGKGDYADLAIVDAIELDSEIYAVGFKKGSDLTAKVNLAIKELNENGKLMELAKKYGFENVIKITENID